MSASTRMALGRRAKGTAEWLKVWAETIEDEVKKQGLSMWGGLHPSVSDTGDETLVTLKLGEIRKLVIGMHEQIAEIRRFSN